MEIACRLESRGEQKANPVESGVAGKAAAVARCRLRRAAKVFDHSLSTIKKWWKKAKEGGLEAPREASRGQRLRQ
jgi:transposase